MCMWLGRWVGCVGVGGGGVGRESGCLHVPINSRSNYTEIHTCFRHLPRLKYDGCLS